MAVGVLYASDWFLTPVVRLLYGARRSAPTASSSSPHPTAGVRLWDAATGKQISEQFTARTVAATSAAFSPDGKRIVTAFRDGTARLWDAESGKQIGEPLTGHAGSVVSAAFSLDGKRIVTASVGGCSAA